MKKMKFYTMMFTVITLVMGFTGIFDAENYKELETSLTTLNCCSYIEYEANIDFEF